MKEMEMRGFSISHYSLKIIFNISNQSWKLVAGSTKNSCRGVTIRVAKVVTVHDDLLTQ